MPRETTMLELVSALSARARSEDEVVAWVVALVSSGAVWACPDSVDTRVRLLGSPRAGVRRQRG